LPTVKKGVFKNNEMKKLSIVLLIGLLSSCSPIYYAPNSHNVPMFTEQGQGDFGFGGSLLLPSNEVTGFNSSLQVQAGYALFPNVAVQLN